MLLKDMYDEPPGLASHLEPVDHCMGEPFGEAEPNVPCDHSHACTLYAGVSDQVIIAERRPGRRVARPGNH